MKIYEKIKINIDTGEVLEEKSYDYNGPVVHCGGASIGYLVLQAIISAILSYAISEIFGTDPKKPKYKGGGSGIKANTRSTQESVKIIYGKQRVGGNDVYGTTLGQFNKYLYLVQTLSEGECEGIDEVDGVPQIFIDDKIYTDFGGNISYNFHDGNEDQTVDSLIGGASAQWTDPLQHTSYIAWRFTWNENKFRGLPKRQLDVKGIKVVDFRGGDSTTAWSDNPVLCLYDFMTNTSYGLGIDDSKFDIPSFTAAANYCEAQGWALNLIVDPAEQGGAWGVVEEIQTYFRGNVSWFDGKYYLKYADLYEESSEMTIEDEHIYQGADGQAAITITQPPRTDKPDGIRVTFIDKEKQYTQDDIIIGDQDGVLTDFTLLGCTDRQQASDLGVSRLERLKLNRIISGQFRGDCLRLEPQNIITFNSTALAISNQLMRVVETSFNSDHSINLSLMFESYDLYDDDYDTDIEGVYSVDLPNRFEPALISNASVTEEVYNYRLRSLSRLNVSFTVPDTQPWFKHVEVWVSTNGDVEANYTHQFNAINNFTIDPAQEGNTYWIILRTVNIHEAKQDLAAATKLSELVDGKSNDPPTSPSPLTAIASVNSIFLTSEKVNDPDIEVYEFRLGSQWSGGIHLTAKRSPTESISSVKPGIHTFTMNTKGTNGLYGVTPVSAQAIIPSPKGWTTYQTFYDDYDIVGGAQTFDNCEQTIYDAEKHLINMHGNLIQNGNMEFDDYWIDYSSPSTNERSSEQKQKGTYSRKFIPTSTNDGIRSEGTFTTETDKTYNYQLQIYSTQSNVTIAIRKGDNSAWALIRGVSLTPNEWNLVDGSYVETAGGSGAYAVVHSGASSSGSYYVDGVLIYDAVAGIDLESTYESEIFDLGAGNADIYYMYVEADIIITGAGTTWNAVIPLPNIWSSINIDTNTWNQIFELTEAPQVNITIRYKENIGDGWSEVKHAEILSGIGLARYFQVVIEITDPSQVVNAQVSAYTLHILS